MKFALSIFRAQFVEPLGGHRLACHNFEGVRKSWLDLVPML
jgi:hypothetical protein